MQARLENVQLQNELKMMQLMYGLYTPSMQLNASPDHDGYMDDVAGHYVVPMQY